MATSLADNLLQNTLLAGQGDRAPKMSGSGFMDYLDKGLALYEKGQSAVGTAANYVSSEDFNNVRNGVNGAMGLVGRKNPESRTLYPGEKHAVVLSGDYKGSNYNYLGPGTRLRERQMRGDRPINSLDQAAYEQDILYSKARTGGDIRLADIAAMARFENDRSDPVAGKAAARLLRAKMAGETGIRLDVGLDPMMFAGESAPIYGQEVGGSGLPGDRLRAYAKKLKKSKR